MLWALLEMLQDCLTLSPADVYAFAIVVWELLTHNVPYGSMSPAAAAVAVIKNNTHPELADLGVYVEHYLNIDHCEMLPHLVRYIELMCKCWNCHLASRPTF